MKLIIGLGNPGDRYIKTRHNVGFLSLDAFAIDAGLSWTSKAKLGADITHTESYILAKPTTFMNNSGQAVQAIVKYYKIEPEHILVISDDIDRNFGELRLRADGGDGGHNGLKDIITAIGENFWRLRVGVANEYREHYDAADFVLQNFSATEFDRLSLVGLGEINDVIKQFVTGSLASHSWNFS